MDKLRMKSGDAAEGNVAKMAALFPQCVTEHIGKDGKPELAIDFDKLKDELSKEVIDTGEERYQFTWPDKRAASRLANESTDKTLRPCKEESVDFDATQNLYIEGDNLDVLKILRENYLGAVKMIYIDPPYNTGNDFVYSDKFAVSSEEWNEQGGAYDENGNLIVDPMQRNTEANGRFHTDWLNMIYPRLKVARDLLAEDGVIFISIDDSEQENLRKVCDEIFGIQNFIAQCVRKRRDSQANLSKNISPIHEYVLIYARKNGDVLNKVAANIDESAYKNPDNDPRGAYVTMPCTNKGGAVYSVKTPTGKEITEEWRFKRETYDALLNDNRLVFPKGGEGKPRYKLFLTEKKAEGQLANTWLDTLASNQEATREIKDLFDGSLIFDTPKPVGLLTFCIQLATNKDSIILDFFSGSAACAHATMLQNAEDGGHRRFIMVQLPEVTEEKSEARKAGYANICEIGKERIRRAGKKIKDALCLEAEKNKALADARYAIGEDVDKPRSLWDNLNSIDEKNKLLDEADRLSQSANDLDIGFRVLKLDSSNMEDVFYRPEDFDPSQISGLIDNVKPDRTPLDLLFQVMPELNIELSAHIEEKDVNGKKVFFVDDTYLIATFDKDVNESTITEIAKMKPQYFVMRDASAANDNVLDNFEQIFRHYSPDTVRRVM